MRNVKTLWITALLAALVAGPGIAEQTAAGSAGDGAKHEKRAMRSKGKCTNQGDHKGIGHGLVSELGLSSNKAAEVKNLMNDTRQAMLKLRKTRNKAKGELDQLFKADPLDEKAIMVAADKLAQINLELTMTMTKGRLAVNAALTPEQRARVHEFRQKAMKRFKKRGEARRGEGREKHEKRGSGSGSEAGSEPASEGGGI